VTKQIIVTSGSRKTEAIHNVNELRLRNRVPHAIVETPFFTNGGTGEPWHMIQVHSL
jgi:hypothetical protein